MPMEQPTNSISMVGGKGPHGMIDMGGMFTIVKIRDQLAGDGDPGLVRRAEGDDRRPTPPPTSSRATASRRRSRDQLTTRRPMIAR